LLPSCAGFHADKIAESVLNFVSVEKLPGPIASNPLKATNALDVPLDTAEGPHVGQ
jgi:hypothetical protein